MTVEVHDNSGDLAVPQSNASIFVADGENIGIGPALSYGCDLGAAPFVPPPAQQLALLDIPADNFFIGGDNGLASAGGCASFTGPYDVGGA
jgi:hypothetical protein